VGGKGECEQAQHVLGVIQHFAINDQESGAKEVNFRDQNVHARNAICCFSMGGDSLAQPRRRGSYTAVTETMPARQYLLTAVLRKDWNSRVFVVSDWGRDGLAAKAPPPNATIASF